MSEADNVVQGLFDSEKWQSLLSRNARGNIMECWQNVRTILCYHPAWAGVVAFNEFSQEPEKTRGVPGVLAAGGWLPDDKFKIGMWLQEQLKFTVKSVATLEVGVEAAASERKFHPVRAWLDGLAWDDQPRLDDWLCDALGVRKTRYSMLVGRLFLVNMVARIYEPGCIMRSVPVLEGGQNRGKSESLRALAGRWFSDAHLDLSSKDTFELIQGVWLHEIAEMHSVNRAEVTKVKHFISVREDSWVPKWIRRRIIIPRQVVFAGSTNEHVYLRDWTGNTRFWPVRCEEVGDIDLAVLHAQREQLFAEAVREYKLGSRRHPTREEEEELFAPEQDARLLEHHWHSPIAHWLVDNTYSKVTAHQVLKDALHVETSKITSVMHADVGRVMARLGWARERESKGARDWFYIRPSSPPPATGTTSSETVENSSNGIPF